MAQIGVDPATGRITLDGQLLDRIDPRMWGSLGRNVLDPSTAAPGALDASNYDPEFYEPYQYPTGDSDTATAYRLKPQYQGLGTQLGSSGIGGYGEVKDPSKLTWDDRFGIMSPRDNINAPDSNWLNEGGIFALAALPFLGPMAMEAMSGAGAAGAGVDFATGAGLGGSAGEAAAAGGMGGMGGGVGGAAGLATDIAPGYLAESVAPQVTEAMAGSPWDIPVGPMLQESVAPQVTEQMVQSPFLTPTISVDPMLEESVAPQVTEPMSGSPFSESWLDKLPDLARDLLGGGQQGGANPIVAALMGGAGKLGEHRQDNDPYGLMASGYGPWKGLTDDPKAKVVDAMMKRKQDSIWS